MNTFSPAGSLLMGYGAPAAAGNESDEERRKRLAAVAAQREKLGVTSPAGAALFGGAMGAYGYGG
jgi:hypothetical protein